MITNFRQKNKVHQYFSNFSRNLTVELPNFDSLMSSRISLLLVSQILIGGIQLRRGIAIKDYKDKLSNARAKAFYFNQESNQEQSSKEDDSGELKSNTPITTLDWHPY